MIYSELGKKLFSFENVVNIFNLLYVIFKSLEHELNDR